MSARAILSALRTGPRTNRELQALVCDHSGAISRDCWKLRQAGKVKRIDGRSGRGTEAVYAIA